MRANVPAEAVRSCWNDLPNHYPNVELDEFVMMPNHVH
jgi:REP element-mobilizing transposase RayT